MAEDKTDKTAEKKSGNQPEWGGFKGTPVAGSLTEDGDKLSAMFKTAEGKEHKVIAYPHSTGAADKLRAAVDAGEEIVLRGPMLGSTAKGTFHFGAAQFTKPGEPKAKAEKAELTEEEKAAKAEAAAAGAAERDKTRVPVIEGSVAEGDDVTVGGETVKVESLGRAWELDTDGAEKLKARFPEVDGIEAGAKVQFATFKEPELDGPGM